MGSLSADSVSYQLIAQRLSIAARAAAAGREDYSERASHINKLVFAETVALLLHITVGEATGAQTFRAVIVVVVSGGATAGKRASTN